MINGHQMEESLKVIGQRLVEIRRDMGATQKEFALKIGASIGTVQAYEYGKIPKGDVLKKLSELGYDLNWLFTGFGTMKISTLEMDIDVERKIAWNVAYYLCKRTNTSSDPKVFADVFLELHDWMVLNNRKPEEIRAPAEITAQVIDFATQRLNIR